MDFQLNKIHDILLISIGCLFFVSCSGQEILKLNQYQLDINNVKGISLDYKAGYTLDDSSNNYLLCLADTSIIILDILKDSIIKIIPKPTNVEYHHNISFPDVNHFCIYQGYDNPAFWAYFDGELHEYKLAPEKTGFSVFRPTLAQYFPKRNEIYFNILPLKKYTRELQYTWPAFAKLNLSTGKLEELNIRASEKYWGNKLYIPVIYTSQSMGKFLIISYSFDEDIIKYNVETQEQERIEINYQGKKLPPINPSVEKGAARKDLIQKSMIVDDEYFTAFFDEKEKAYYRVFKPGIPIHDENGEYFTPKKNKSAMIIKKTKDNTYYYQLPMGIFNHRYKWKYSPLNKTINFPIQNKIFKNSDSYNFTLYRINMYNF